MQFKTYKTLQTVLLILLCLIASFDGHSQIKMRTHYKIKNKNYYKLTYSTKHRKLKKDIPEARLDSILRGLTKYQAKDSLWFDSIQIKKVYENPNISCIRRRICGEKIKANLFPDSNKLKVVFWSYHNIKDSIKYVSENDSMNSYYIMFPKSNTLKDTPRNYISIPFAWTEIGAVTVPFKFRFAHGDSIPNDLSSAFNAGVYVGRKWGRTRFYENKDFNHNSIGVTLAAFAAPTQITIESANTEGRVKNKANELGLSTGVGLMLEIHNDFNIGFFGGIDIPVSGKSYYWDYANKLWIGFGIGYKLTMFGGGE